MTYSKMNLRHHHNPTSSSTYQSSFQLFRDYDILYADAIDVGSGMDTMTTATTTTASSTTAASYDYQLRNLQSRGNSRSPSVGHDGIRLGFLMPLIVIILCIVSGSCKQNRQQVSPISATGDDDINDATEKKKKETPEFRKQRLIKSFEANNVLMVVKKDENLKQIIKPTQVQNNTDDENQPSSTDIEEGMMVDAAVDNYDFTESDDNIQLFIPRNRKAPQGQYVSNMCCICLEEYCEGDVIVWSSNNQCQHVFHELCLVDYLVKVKKGRVPCPTCRQDFIDLIDMKMVEDSDSEKNSTATDVSETSTTSNTAAASTTTAATTTPVDGTADQTDATDETATANTLTNAEEAALG